MIRKATSFSDRKILIYGPSGSGKTRFLGTASQDERTAPMIVLNNDRGGSSLSGSDVDIWDIRDWTDYTEAYAFLSQSGHPYKSIALDTLTESHMSSLLKIVELQADHDPKRPFRELEIQQGDYGKSLVQMRRLIRSFRDLPYHIFYTAQIKTELETGEGWVRKPYLAGQLADELLGLFDVTGCLVIVDAPETVRQQPDSQSSDGGFRSLLLNNHPGFRVKVRMPWDKIPPSLVWNPTVTKLFDIMEVNMKS